MNQPQNQGNVPQNQGAGNPAQNSGQEQSQTGQQNQSQAQQTTETTQPEPQSQRTREQFEKLLESNRSLYQANEQLRQELTKRQQPKQASQPQGRQAYGQQTQPQSQQVQQQAQQLAQAQSQLPQGVDPKDFIERDPVTGEQYINETKMRARIQEIEDRAQRAEQTIQSYIQTNEQREIARQNQTAFSKYPELEPGSEKFNEQFHKQVRGVLYDSMLNADEYGGRQLEFVEAANFVKGQTNPAQPTPDEGGDEAPSSETTPEESTASDDNSKKEQGSAHVQSQPQNAPADTTSEELELLRLKTRMGDDRALAQRLVSTEHTRASEEADEE